MDDFSGHSWLDALSSHAIFKPSASRKATASSSPLPPSPNASRISLHSLASGLHDELEDDQHGLAQSMLSSTSACCIARKTELCVADGSQIRILNLASFKAKQESNSSAMNGTEGSSTPSARAGPSSSSSSAGSYKVLREKPVQCQEDYLFIDLDDPFHRRSEHPQSTLTSSS